jgi:hypothetical protein
MNQHGNGLSLTRNTWARIAGAMYLFIVAAGVFAEGFIRSRMVVSADAAATAANFVREANLLRIGISAEMLMWVFDVAIAIILYMLLRPAGLMLSAIMASLRLTTVAILAVNSLFQFAALLLLGDAAHLEALGSGERETMALVSMKLHGMGYAVALVFFGFHCLLLGALVVRAACFPRWLGLMLAIAGACYLVNSFSLFLAPALAAVLFPLILVPAFIAELTFGLWLLIRGVGAQPARE